ncbi:MAG TPA: VanZ family protein [Anaeromyxobacteraceae bacterium]|jgi:VanZ family protein
MRPLARFLPALAWAAGVFWLSSQSSPLPFLPEGLFTFDKVLHALEYAAGGALLAWALLPRGPRAAFLLAALLAAAYGASDEVHQGLVPGRDGSLADWVADLAGAVAGAWALVRARRGKPAGG